MGRLCRCAPFVLQLLEAPGVGHLHAAILATPAVEGLFADIGLAADLLDGLTTVGLAQEADDLFGRVSLFLHVRFWV